MKYTTLGNCPFCDNERGVPGAWGMTPDAMARLKEEHDAGHPRNDNGNTQPGLQNFCPNCGHKLP